MFKHQEERIDRVLHKLIKSNGRFSNGIHENTIQTIWSSVLGTTIDRYTTKLTLKNGTLRVKLSSAALRNELQFEKEKLKEKLNEHLEYKQIQDIIIS